MKTFRRLSTTLVYSLFGAGLIFSFQNCSPTNFASMSSEGKLGGSAKPMNFKIEAPLIIPVGQMVRFRIDADEDLDSVGWTHPEHGMIRVNSADGAADVSFSQAGEMDMWVEVTRGDWTSGRVGFRVSVVNAPGDVCAPLNAMTAPVEIIGSQQLFTLNATAIAQSIYSIEGRMLTSLQNPSIICHELLTVLWTIDNGTTPVASGTPVAVDIGNARTNPYNLKAAMTFRSNLADGSPGNNTVIVHRSLPVRVSTSTTPITCTPAEMNLRLSGPSLVAVGQPAVFNLDLNCLPKNVHTTNGVEFRLNSGSFVGQNTFMYSQTFQAPALNQVLSARIKYADGLYSPEVTKTFNVVGDLTNCTTGPFFSLVGPDTVNFYDNGTQMPATFTVNTVKPSCVSINLTPPKVISWTSNNSTSTSAVVSNTITLGLAGDLASAPDLIRATFEDNLGRSHTLELPITLDRINSPPPNCEMSLTSVPGIGVVNEAVSFNASISSECASGGYQVVEFQIKDSEGTALGTEIVSLTNSNATYSFQFAAVGNYSITSTAGFTRGRGPIQFSTLSASLKPFSVVATQPVCTAVAPGLNISPEVADKEFPEGSLQDFVASIFPDSLHECLKGTIETEWLLNDEFVYLRDGTDGLSRMVVMPSGARIHQLTLKVYPRRAACRNASNGIEPDGTANGINYDYNSATPKGVPCKANDPDPIITKTFNFTTKGIGGENCTATIAGPTDLNVGDTGTFVYTPTGSDCGNYNQAHVTLDDEFFIVPLPDGPYVYTRSHTFLRPGTRSVSVQLMDNFCGPGTIKGDGKKLGGLACPTGMSPGPLVEHTVEVQDTKNFLGTWFGNCVNTCQPIIGMVKGWTCVWNGASKPTMTDPVEVCGPAPSEPPPDNVQCLAVMPICVDIK